MLELDYLRRYFLTLGVYYPRRPFLPWESGLNQSFQRPITWDRIDYGLLIPLPGLSFVAQPHLVRHVTWSPA